MKWGRGARVAPEIPTASMADIAFLLIVFFLVSTTMNQDKGLSLHLPAMGEGQEMQSKNICNLWITQEDVIAIFENDNLTPVPFEGLQAEIARRLAANDKLVVSVLAQRGATYRTFVDVLDELKLAGARKISIANPEE
ncbi:MAG: biopolymer transporter ExbD [Gemmatimonadetes bacterium]|nr:biopolymer transporter ExbD [Gemmatimonadota bacterium]